VTDTALSDRAGPLPERSPTSATFPETRKGAAPIVRGRAPLRISFAGGGTDVEPYLSERGGAVLSTTIDKYAYASLRMVDEPGVTVKSLDYDIVAKYELDEPAGDDDELGLVKAVIRRLCRNESGDGLEFFLHSDAPPGSGLGSSSTMVVALIGLFRHWLHLPLTDYEAADLAYRIERVDLGITGGRQDHYAATFGGFNFIEFHHDTTIVNPLRVPSDTLNELWYNLLLCYTGRTRRSAGIIDSQIAAYVGRDEAVMRAMDNLKENAVDLKNALLQGRLDDFGFLLHEAWLNKKKMASQISDPHIDALYEAALQQGALGGKLSGAGAGGYMTFYCRFDRKHLVARELERLGAQVVEFNFDLGGLQAWEVR
jgi:D-glycero-alpha-D-manno-heptose-7-phosphate kinase